MIYEKKFHGIIVLNSEKLELIEMFIVERKLTIIQSDMQLSEEQKVPLCGLV